ncbi:MAG TPA: TIGR03986 family CRISPR-associated RAMP protein, partial [Arcobacter sp.]|nr:TIGR03986 family CRISPR-associated RAMP protein [Arcobacter sp.]
GSSVKGMVRNVLEIMSFSKMSQFDDDTYAFRDLNNKKDYMNQMKPTNTFCGWLKKKDNRYVIEDCGKPGRIRLDKIDNKCFLRFSKEFDEKEEENKTAQFKYELFDDIELPTYFSHQKNHNGRDVYIQGNDKEGTVVFTGQPSARKEGEDPKGKIYEFIFFKSTEELELQESIFDNFKFAYFDERKTQPKESLDWSYWKEKLENENLPEKERRVPIFFQKDNNGKIKHFGLSYLYKLPYNYSIKNAVKSISKEHFSDKLDLAQTIFGYLDEENKKALKGRVQFSHFKADSKPEKFKTITTVLGSPRASYYPIYIKQDYTVGGKWIKSENYHTLMNKDSQIAGRKRYPLHQNIPNPKEYDKSEKSATTFTPLGTYHKESKQFNEFTFSGKLRYHNLKKEELGAILSALTFHGNSDTFYHNIGMAKPLGFGKINIEVSLDVNQQVEMLKKYEALMQKEFNNRWLETEQLKELFTMANKHIAIDKHLKYLILNPTNSTDEFRSKKSDREYLPLVTTLSKSNIQINSILNQNNINDFLESEEKKQKLLQKEKDKVSAQNELLNSTPERMSKAFKDAIQNYILKNITLPYYDYSDLKKVFEGKEDDIVADDVYNAYMDLVDKQSFEPIEKLLLKREQNKASELELAELYRLLSE